MSSLLDSNFQEDRGFVFLTTNDPSLRKSFWFTVATDSIFVMNK